MTFYDKYMSITQSVRSYVCVGLDSDYQKLPQCLSGEGNPQLIFNKRIIDATHKYVAAYKPNFAFYLSGGIPGIETLKQTIEYIPCEIPVIIDIKAGDIGNTMVQYARALFTYFGADAITINTLMGTDVVEACLSVEGSFAFALALTSNPSADDCFKHHLLYEKIAKMITNTDERRLGAVVGATQKEDLATMRELMPSTIFLVPGIGAQGGDLASVCKYASYTTDDRRLLINSSRDIIFADTSPDFATIAQKQTIKLRDAINQM